MLIDFPDNSREEAASTDGATRGRGEFTKMHTEPPAAFSVVGVAAVEGTRAAGSRGWFAQGDGQPVRDGHRVGRVGQLTDPVQPVLVAPGHALVLAQVVLPARQDGLLEDRAWGAGVLPGSPGGRSVRRRLNPVLAAPPSANLPGPVAPQYSALTSTRPSRVWSWVSSSVASPPGRHRYWPSAGRSRSGRRGSRPRRRASPAAPGSPPRLRG